MSVAVYIPFGFYPFNYKAFIKPVKKIIPLVPVLWIRIAKHEISPSFVHLFKEMGQPYLIMIKKPVFAIACETGSIVLRAIGGIKINQRICLYVFSALFKVSAYNLGIG